MGGRGEIGFEFDDNEEQEHEHSAQVERGMIAGHGWTGKSSSLSPAEALLGIGIIVSFEPPSSSELIPSPYASLIP